MTRKPTARLIAFSGIDGAGKSTQIESLCDVLTHTGYSTRRVTLWDNIAVLPRLRAGMSLRALRGKQPRREPRTLRNDKNVRTWYLSVIRAGFYLLDALRCRVLLNRLRRDRTDFIILDRWSYDQLVHIRPSHGAARAFIRLVLAIAPEPDVAFVLDASPDDAFRRKPEYPLEFMREYRRAYLQLRHFVPGLTVIAPASIAEMHGQIVDRVLRCRLVTHSTDGVQSDQEVFPGTCSRENRVPSTTAEI